MHDGCVEIADSTKQGVTAAARLVGFLEFLPIAAGIRRVVGEVWDLSDFTSGSSRMSEDVLQRHRAWVEQHDGTPPRPDWNTLTDLAQKFRDETEAKTAALKSPAAAAAAAAAAEAENNQEQEPITSFLDILKALVR